ncbi:MAG: sigma 54-interacting transcriptional regulator [Desulfobacteraceae bacterium]|nr:sigma 54-interacting transcriptional regulator [Desulfobacteraceae bacterium]
MEIKTKEQLIAEVVQLHAKVSLLEHLSRRHEKERAAFAQSEMRYRTMFENTGAATFVKEADMTISMVNQGFERLTGYTKTEIEGRMRWTDFIHPEDRPRMIGYHADRRQDREAPSELELRILDRGGAVKDVYLKLGLIPDTQRTIGSFVDLTQLKQARREIQESQALFQAIVEGFEGFLYVCDSQYRLAYLNPQCRRQVGRNAIGEICYKAIHHRESPCLFCVHSQIQQGQAVRFEILNPKNKRWYLSINSPIRHVGGEISLLAMVTDINDRKQTEAALRATDPQPIKEEYLPQPQATQRQSFGHIVGQSSAMQKVYEQILSAAATDATVIIYGEPGTGKELVANAIHDMSERRTQRFVPVHCGAIPENLIESEFFGYLKGAFSGADNDKPGYVDFADGGTMFLDEIGEITLHMQVKLLRVIEGKGYTPVGSNRVKQSNLRIIAATNRDLRERIRAGIFREDFFYRIHILPIQLPPLRERKEDLPLLIDHFLKLYGGKQTLPPLTGKMMELLRQHNWPGNVRELQNVIIRFCSLQVLELGAGVPALQPPIVAADARHRAPAGQHLKGMLAEHEKQLILQTLEQTLWHRGRTARQLGMDRKTLFAKMKRYGIG